MVISHAWPRGRDTPLLRRWVLAGLLLTLAGDVARAGGLAAGGALFVLSDALLATNKFTGPLPHGQLAATDAACAHIPLNSPA